MGVFDYQDARTSTDGTGPDAGGQSTAGDDVSGTGDVQPVSVVDHGGAQNTQLKVTVPAKFADRLDLTADDYVLMELLEDGAGIMVRGPDG